MELKFDIQGRHVIGDTDKNCVIIFKHHHQVEGMLLSGVIIENTHPVWVVVKTTKGSFTVVRLVTKELLEDMPEDQFYEYYIGFARRLAKKEKPRVKFID